MHTLQPARVPFVDRLAQFGDRPAVVTDSGTVTYTRLAGLVAAHAEGLGPTRRLVLLTMRNDLDTVVGYLGALAGGHVVLVAPERDDVVAGLVAAYEPDVVGRGSAWVERRIGTAHELHPELALLLSTSGSTGSPRLVRLSAENLQANAVSIAEALGIRGTDVAATTLPLHYCYGMSVLHSHLVRGAAVRLTELSVVDACFWELVRRDAVTSFAGVPYTFELLDKVGFDTMELPSLRYLTQAGGRLAPEKVRRYAELGHRRGFDLFVMYGQTEATARMTCLPPHLALEHPESIGVPIPGGSVRLDPEPEDPTVGEIVYAGPNVMLGYAESPADLALGRVVTELRTGDLARRTETGLLQIVGRKARFAKVRGLRIDLERVERLLERPVSCAATDEMLVVAVEAAAGTLGRRTSDRVRREVGGITGLPASAVRVVGVEELPRLSNGKPDYAALRTLAADQEAPRDVPGAFRGVLGKPHVHADDTFVSLGGDSLSYVEMSVQLEELLGHLPTRWHLRPVAELEELRRERRRAPDPGRRSSAFRSVSRLRTVETNVALRALAILAIVGTHGNLFTVTGGAHLLLVLVGFNLARFHLTGADRGERARRLLRSAARVAVPSVLWVGGATLLASAYPWQTALLLNGAFGPESWSEPAWHYWFIEALVATLLALAALLAVPAVDRAERRWPFWFPVGLAVLALTTRYELVVLRGGDVIHRAHVLLWLVALGWAAARATSPTHRAVVSVLTVATVPGFFEDPAREAVVVLGMLAVVWVPTVRVPAALARACGVLAASSLYVYLTHWQVYPHLEEELPAAAVAASFVVGIVVWRLAGLVTRGSGHRLHGRVRQRPITAEQHRPGAGNDGDRDPGADLVPDPLLPRA